MVAPLNLNDVVCSKRHTIEELFCRLAIDRDLERLNLVLGEIKQPEVS